MKYKKLQMPEEDFFKVLERMLEMHEMMLKMPKKYRDNSIKLYGSIAKQTLSYYDDFYEFLQHWEDYKKKKWSN
jgi:hypothetical protein